MNAVLVCIWTDFDRYPRRYPQHRERAMQREKVIVKLVRTSSGGALGCHYGCHPKQGAGGNQKRTERKSVDDAGDGSHAGSHSNAMVRVATRRGRTLVRASSSSACAAHCLIRSLMFSRTCSAACSASRLFSPSGGSGSADNGRWILPRESIGV